MTFEPVRGQLYWVHLDKRRPAVVMSTNLRNALANDVILVPCSSTHRPLLTHVRLGSGERSEERRVGKECRL